MAASPFVIGLDFGLKRLGVAIGDLESRMCRPLVTIHVSRQQPDWIQLAKLIEEWQPAAIILGQPGTQTTGSTQINDAINAFGAQLNERFSIPVHQVDETLSSRGAESILREQRQQGTRSRRVRKKDVDQLAATLILETWLAQQ